MQPDLYTAERVDGKFLLRKTLTLDLNLKKKKTEEKQVAFFDGWRMKSFAF